MSHRAGDNFMAVDDLDGARFPLQRVGGFQVSAHSKTCRSSQNTVTALVAQAESLPHQGCYGILGGSTGFAVCRDLEATNTLQREAGTIQVINGHEIISGPVRHPMRVRIAPGAS